ncbi:MAG: DUF547 domain-containing protein, partial [Phycisphaeraceae bacterium]|nr:DUF547 domain-containing protein [Phycisphaeraceae bacterium]
RPNFREPRIHFALVCAAIGCPPLRTEAYTGERIDKQLEDQTRYVHAHPRWFRRTGPDQIHLTRLYDWYGGDFEQIAGSVLAWVGRYQPEVARQIEADNPPDIKWLDYDWTLNAPAFADHLPALPEQEKDPADNS